jgi:hypothetical protein
VSAWILIPCLRVLRDEFNALAPGRDKGADGSIGDTAHAAGGTSDHLPDEDFAALRGKDSDSVNEVHALDIDSTGPWPDGLTMDKIVAHILSYCRRASSDLLNEPRLRYIIWNRKIYKAPNWAAETYTGTADPHTNHAHFSAEYVSSLEADTSTWHLEDLVALTDAEIVKIADTVWNRMFADPYDGEKKKAAYTLLAWGGSRAGVAQATKDALVPVLASLGAQVDGVDEAVLRTLADAARSDEQVADALRAALGDRAAAVGALLAA